MFNKEKALQQLKKLFNNSPVRLIAATVLSVEGETCTVQPLGSDLTLPGVHPFVMGANEQKLIVVPAIGSTVLIKPIGEKVAPEQLLVCWISEPDSFYVVADGHVFDFGKSGVFVQGPIGCTELTSAVLQKLPSI